MEKVTKESRFTAVTSRSETYLSALFHGSWLSEENAVGICQGSAKSVRLPVSVIGFDVRNG